MRFLYTLGIYAYNLVLTILATFNKKARLWKEGRRNILSRLENELNEYKEKKIIWFHCASLGEFEQGRPVIEEVKRNYPEHLILLTFFSPSGYEVRKNYSNADLVYYLPSDTPVNAKRFIEITKPALAVFVKYEFWFNYLNELKKAYIPVLYISSIFRSNQYFFKPHGKWFLEHLKDVKYFFVQNAESEELLNNAGISNILITGDTRFDRVSQTANSVIDIPDLNKFKDDKLVIIAGSTWPSDEYLLSWLFNHYQEFSEESFKLIIVPHEITESEIEKLLKRFEKNVVLRLSKADDLSLKNSKVLIIDTIGLLSKAYKYGDIAYVGGGFTYGIHNILEAATYGLPVIFGPKYQRFKEAKDLIEIGGAFSIQTKEDLLKEISSLLTVPIQRQEIKKINKNYIKVNEGATARIMKKISEILNSDSYKK